MKDMKESLSSARKPDLTHVRGPLLTYVARACEWGSPLRYPRANFLRPASEYAPGTPEATAADFERLRAYAAAARRHLTKLLDRMELHQATDPDLRDIDGMKLAAYAEDTDVCPKTGLASGLPSLCGAGASLNMAITQAVTFGLLPEDPGQPWAKTVEVAPKPKTLLQKLEEAAIMPLAVATRPKRYGVHKRDTIADNGRAAWFFGEAQALSYADDLNHGRLLPVMTSDGPPYKGEMWAVVEVVP